MAGCGLSLSGSTGSDAGVDRLLAGASGPVSVLTARIIFSQRGNFLPEVQIRFNPCFHSCVLCWDSLQKAT